MQQASRSGYHGTTIACRKLSNFTIVESKYTAGQDLKSHVHERAYISIVLRGSYTEKCGSSNLSCDTGHMILHATGEMHSNHFYEDGCCLNIEMLPHFSERLRQYGIDKGTRISMAGRRYTRLGFTLQSETAQQDSASELVIEGLTMELIGQLVRGRAETSAPCKERWLARVNELLHDRFRESLTLKELAESAQVHPVHLARTFRKQYGCSIGDYIRKLRVVAASNDISNSKMSIADIASRNGFADQSHLCRIMKQYIGKSPRQLRCDN